MSARTFIASTSGGPIAGETHGEEAAGASPLLLPGATYFDEGFWTADTALSALRRQVGANHRTVATYLNALRRHGLWLDEVREPPESAEWSAKRGDAGRYPIHFAARCLAGRD